MIEKYGAEVSGKGRVFAKDMGGWTAYSLGFSSKNQEGKYENGYQPIRFRKGESVPDRTDINYRGFVTVGKGKNGNFILWQIMEYRICGDDMAQAADDGFAALQNDDIPF